ncbi:MAG TPA: 4-(cytidine 5'-diphospho)-2-C-methyl-D-erythritol kinase, partial [Prolixibacteraceae bacterium]|nr:4-(cytidine 5'-diphospho)-2-C-methyl-D-erythritol kinase [Prolixibacteraceae bacterium]
LEVIRKRDDGFHDIETVFYPLSLSDILEMNVSANTSLTLSGIDIVDDPNNNLVMKAYRLLKNDFSLPPVSFHLHKQIPTGAGLGGGSADGAYTLKGLNTLFNLNIDAEKLENYASQLGSDCAFFIQNKPVFAEGRGNIFTTTDLSLKDYWLVLVKPACAVSTAQAYGGVKPEVPGSKLTELVKMPVSEWEGKVVNRFEKSVFGIFPEIERIKQTLFQKGAIYTAMSGSGSTVFGIFDQVPDDLKTLFQDYFYHQECFK